MIRRRLWLKSLFTGAVALLPWRKNIAQEGHSTNAAEQLTDRQIAPLKDQLKKGLRVVSPDQYIFVQVVAERVEQGQLPRAMVNLVYDWALERNPRVPFPYFQFAMRLLARRRNVTLP